MSIRRIGVLTGGGDAPGLNPALKAIVYKAAGCGIEVIGLYDGWQGLLNEGCEQTLRLEDHLVRRWDRDGGTNLGSSRTNPFRAPRPGERDPKDRSAEVLANMERLQLDGVIALGGEDTLGVAHKLCQQGGMVVGIPKTIDNDLSHTDYTLGFDTALRNCTGGHRAGAHAGRIAPLGAGGGSHGSPYGASGAVECGGWRGDDGPHPGASFLL